MAKAGRNDPCPCGSGKKFKACCAVKHDTTTRWSKLMIAALLAVLAGGVYALFAGAGDEARTTPGGVWSPEHGHYH